MQPVPKIAAIHDISGLGRCSLTAVLPVLSAMGVQVCPLPTAVLSTQTDGYKGFSFSDFTDDMPEYIAHWRSLRVRFDAIYSGFLGSERQIDLVSDFVEDFSQPDQIVLIDPVLGDCGSLYTGFGAGMVANMRMLVNRAHIITPNLTEALFLLDEPCETKPVDDARLRQFLQSLGDMGPEMVVITGALDSGGRRFNAGFSRSENRYWNTHYEPVPVNYPGSGDIFAAVLLGRLLKGAGLGDAMSFSADFLTHLITYTHAAKTPRREGLLLERALHLLQP